MTSDSGTVADLVTNADWFGLHSSTTAPYPLIASNLSCDVVVGTTTVALIPSSDAAACMCHTRQALGRC
jgi:hypothetical protein